MNWYSLLRSIKGKSLSLILSGLSKLLLISSDMLILHLFPKGRKMKK